MNKWLPAALDYIPRWIEFQMAESELPGCVIAIAEKGKIVLDQAFGYARSRSSRGADAAPSFPRRLAFEKFHQRRDYEAARTGAAQA